MFLPNFDGDTVDAPGRRKDGRGGSGRGRRTAAGLLTLGCWCTGRASCLFSSFGRHFLKEGVYCVIVVLILYRSIDQFQNLEGIAGRILGYLSQSPTFFVREIFDGIVANAGGEDIHRGCPHRRRLQQSRVKYHGLPEAPLVRADHDS